MAENSKIEWTTHTFNPWRGCSKVAPGCANCYADDLSKRNPGTLGTWGPNGTRVVASESMWRQPLKWNEAAKQAGERHRVFCASLADVFEDWRGLIRDASGGEILTCTHCNKLLGRTCGCYKSEFRALTLPDVRRRLFALIDSTPHLDWLLLTKRPENILRFWCEPITAGDYSPTAHSDGRHNVWLGTSISDQATADRNIPLLLNCRDLAPVLFVSAEPLLGPVNLSELGQSTTGIRRSDGVLRPLMRYDCLRGQESPLLFDSESCGKIDWLIAGGESGHHARPMHPDWARSLRDQCQAAEVPFLFKQWGEWQDYDNRLHGFADTAEEHTAVGKRLMRLPGRGADTLVIRVGKAAAGRLLDGREWNQYPTVAPSVTRTDVGEGGGS